MRIDDAVLMLSEGSDAYPAFPAMLHAYVADLESECDTTMSTHEEPLAAWYQRFVLSDAIDGRGH